MRHAVLMNVSFSEISKKYIYELVSQKYGNPSIDFVKNVSYGDYFIGKVLFNASCDAYSLKLL